ncbi:hypothetical protein D030_4301A, partial [Vibrio parahaemolyticus AQ3810]
MRLPDRLP